MDPYIGKLLDNRYGIIERIGTGGMAIVYKARDNRLNRLVAVKILRADLAQDEDFRRRFNAESQAVAQLSSPHIVSIYDVSRGGEVEYLVMELIDGITLKQYMEKRGQLNWRESLHFIIQIMRGLAHAHSRGIIHRDIKPQNIMVMRDGSVKVADFGIACLENATQTLTQQALGSVHYISPEQARGERADARSDIYSAGVVLYEMLSGRLPFEGESAVSVAIQHLSSTPPNPRSINPDIPEQLELICLKAMAPELARRYASSEEMIRDLEAFRKNPEIRLDFQMSDIRPAVTDEPTRPLGRAELAAVSASQKAAGSPEAEESKSVVQTVLFWVAGVLSILLAIVLFRPVLSSLSPAAQEEAQEQHVVQSVLGYTVEQARDLEGVKGVFEIREVGQRSSEDYPQGTIISQDPEANNYRKGSNLVIRVWVSSGEETGEMPNVVNQTVAQVEKVTMRAQIAELGLTLLAPEEDMIYHNDFPSGYIISSKPAAGETLHRGDTIRLVLSKGPQTATLVSFVNMNYFTQVNSVNSMLDSMNVEVGEIELIYSDKEFGTILRQTPEAGTKVRSGEKINFTVSQGEEPPPPEETLEVVIPLPQDRETAYMEVDRDGTRILSRTVDCTEGSASLRITGNGEAELTVYLDRTEYYKETVRIEDGEIAVLSQRSEAAEDGANPDIGAESGEGESASGAGSETEAGSGTDSEGGAGGENGNTVSGGAGSENGNTANSGAGSEGGESASGEAEADTVGAENGTVLIGESGEQTILGDV